MKQKDGEDGPLESFRTCTSHEDGTKVDEDDNDRDHIEI